MRGTIHLIASEDYPWIRDLVATPQIKGSHLRMAQEGMTPAMYERARPVVRKLLEDGPATRDEMREALTRKRIRPSGRQALVHLLVVMTYEGEIVTGPYVGGKETMVLVRDWLPGKPPRPPRDPASELARKYLLGYGPATIDDFRWWSQVPAAAARCAWRELGDELIEDAGLWRLRSQRAAPSRPTGVRLLPMWDHYFLGYRDRSHIGPPQVVAGVGSGGVYGPLVVDDGLGVGKWRLERSGSGYRLGVQPFPRAKLDRVGLQREVKDIARFLETDVVLDPSPSRRKGSVRTTRRT